MTKEEAKKLKPDDWVWAHKMYGSDAMPPTHCQVYASKPDIAHGFIKLRTLSGKLLLSQWRYEVFMTREEAADDMRERLHKAINRFEQANEALMESIQDDLELNNIEIARLQNLLDALAGRKLY